MKGFKKKNIVNYIYLRHIWFRCLYFDYLIRVYFYSKFSIKILLYIFRLVQLISSFIRRLVNFRYFWRLHYRFIDRGVCPIENRVVYLWYKWKKLKESRHLSNMDSSLQRKLSMYKSYSLVFLKNNQYFYFINLFRYFRSKILYRNKFIEYQLVFFLLNRNLKTSSSNLSRRSVFNLNYLIFSVPYYAKLVQRVKKNYNFILPSFFFFRQYRRFQLQKLFFLKNFRWQFLRQVNYRQQKNLVTSINFLIDEWSLRTKTFNFGSKRFLKNLRFIFLYYKNYWFFIHFFYRSGYQRYNLILDPKYIDVLQSNINSTWQTVLGQSNFVVGSFLPLICQQRLVKKFLNLKNQGLNWSLNLQLLGFLYKCFKINTYLYVSKNYPINNYRVRFNKLLGVLKRRRSPILKPYFLVEFINILLLTSVTKDVSFLGNWLRYVIGFLSYRLHWRFISYLRLVLADYFNNDSSIKGLKLVLKGKIGKVGSFRKRKIIFSFGQVSYSNILDRLSWEHFIIKTTTGVVGLNLYLFY